MKVIRLLILTITAIVFLDLSPSLLLNYLIGNELPGGINDVNILSLFINLSDIPFIRRNKEISGEYYSITCLFWTPCDPIILS